MSTAPQDIADPLDDCAEGFEGLSPDKQAELCLLAVCLGWFDRPLYLRYLIEYFQENGPDPDNDRAWAAIHGYEQREGWQGWLAGEDLAQAAGLPNNKSENLYCCQPEQMEFLLRAASGTHWAETVEQKRLSRGLYQLNACRFFELFKTLPFAEALDQIRMIGISCIYHFGFSKLEQRSRLNQLVDQIKWFRDTDGFHRPDGTIDVDAATMRAYQRGDSE
jgi:hypothetical protein